MRGWLRRQSVPRRTLKTPEKRVSTRSTNGTCGQFLLMRRGRVAAWVLLKYITIAILDSGIDYEHADLAGRVDLKRSVSFIPSDDKLVKANFPKKHLIADLEYHGTHVASTVVSNAVGVAGVTSRATLMGVKVCNVKGVCPASAILFGVLHAVDNGADVINLSFGGGFLKAGSGSLIASIHEVFNYARGRGVTIVVSAGNNALNLDKSPNLYQSFCDAPASTCVAATAPNSTGSLSGPWANVDLPAEYTNFGKSAIDVAAPGGGGNGLIMGACSHFSLVIPTCRTSIRKYVFLKGTSSASPHVAGLAALVVEDVGRDPGLVNARIGNGADDVGKKGRDAYSGKGRINVDATAE
eukprot:TRINITY_DN2662_c0_g1_i3.p1 TRINITY_DN2662_c0_g1~~TRINITY_DN2662_c0_g1_i3.p1  ORF type:complete len:353 (-),score=30.13 TRINITY_DN2662_c0_g1_i3:233-1291(-)